ncbi:DNA-binding protein [Jiella endophytica]|uniref:DNA-binding protein n=1 Tax=Jiella endophytica TaxID=2558362 RepID=A0A4Y8RET0_9HYPH|nr:DNA-binding protein [Jiella endophytica]
MADAHCDLLKPSEAARRLAICEDHLRELTNDGLIPYVNVGRGRKREHRRYDPADVEAYKEARKCRSTSVAVPTPIPTTSTIAVIDFQARRDARVVATRKNTSANSRRS